MGHTKRFARTALVVTGATLAILFAACNTTQPQTPASQTPPTLSVMDVSGSVTGDKTVAPSDMMCSGSSTVTVSLSAEAGIAGNPLTIMLVLDRSGSMGINSGAPLADLKAAADGFVDIIDEATDGALDGAIGNGSMIGVVSFATSASLDIAPTADANAVKAQIAALAASGNTDIAGGLNLAAGQSQDVVILFTDGQPNIGPDPVGAATTAATNLKNAGAEIFSIGLGSYNLALLQAIASTPASTHVYTTPDSSDLSTIFAALGAAITVPAASNASVVDAVSSGFSVSGASASKGSVLVSGNMLTWSIGDLQTEDVSLTYTITHDPTQPGGVLATNATIVYTDDEGHSVSFPAPTVNVHGCAASLDLTPASAFNTVGDTHNVTATVSDDFGDPVQGISVDFSVSGGPSVIDGSPSEPTPAEGSDATDANGEAFFSYTNAKASVDTITATAGTQTFVSQVLSDTAKKTWEPLDVAIDIKPGSFPNSYGADSKGNIPVALLGSASFDVSTVDESTLRFGECSTPLPDDHIAHKKGHPQYVNGDAYGDVVYHFPFQDTNLDPADTQGCLGGQAGGLDFLGTDSVNIVPGH
jgi:uncharacterized protein YegL